METKHTKGNWDYTTNPLETPNDEAASVWRTRKLWFSDEVSSTLIAVVSKSVGKDAALANAKLIAAAPEMLEALQEAEKALTHEYWMTGESAAVVRAAIDKSPHIIKIRAAIKKATE